jgi:hypothetical protein
MNVLGEILERRPFVLLSWLSLVYFLVTGVLAVTKPFWYDELITLYISRQPTVGSV